MDDVTMAYLVNAFEDEFKSEEVARVKYNGNLDFWDGRNRTNGGWEGIYYDTQWQGEKDYGLIVTPEEALNEILKSDNDELLDQKRFADLKILAEEMNNK